MALIAKIYLLIFLYISCGSLLEDIRKQKLGWPFLASIISTLGGVACVLGFINIFPVHSNRTFFLGIIVIGLIAMLYETYDDYRDQTLFDELSPIESWIIGLSGVLVIFAAYIFGLLALFQSVQTK